MKHSITGPGAFVGLGALVLAGVFIGRIDLPPLLGGLVQVSGGTAGSSTLQIGMGRSGRLAERISGARTGEARRQVWSGGGQTLILEYQAGVERGRLRLAVERVGIAGRPLWVTAVEDSGRDQVSVPLPSAGNYEVVVRMADFGGHFEVSYVAR